MSMAKPTFYAYAVPETGKVYMHATNSRKLVAEWADVATARLAFAALHEAGVRVIQLPSIETTYSGGNYVS